MQLELLPYVQESIAGLIYLVAGVRLWRLSGRTGHDPEWLLGTSFILWGACYFLYDIPYLLLDESTAAPFLFAARLSLDLGTLAFVIFIRQVFRNEERWAVWLVAATIACLVAGLAGSMWIEDWGGILAASNPWFWPGWLATTVPNVWMATEGFLHCASARRRQRLGLCDAATCHRFLLWGIAGSIWVLLQLAVVFQYFEYEAQQQWGFALGTAVGFLEIAPVVAIWLVFFPPAFYRDWVGRVEAAAA